MSVYDATPAPKSQYEIRRCTQDDADGLAQIGAATFLESYAGWLPGRDVLEHCRHQHSPDRYAQLLLDPATAAWVVELREAPVGYLVLTRPDFPNELCRPDDIELKRMYLFARLQSQGLGTHLLRHAARYAESEGCRRMLVGLHRDNAKALAFYRRNGFLQIGLRTFTVGDSTFTDPVLAKALSVSSIQL